MAANLFAAGSSGRGAEFARYEGSHTTRPYELSVFTTKEWDSPRKRAGIEAYEAELSRLRGSAPPPPP